ncbi:MAG: DUF58 domain-containing protein, partial [Spirochaetales bacterium]|nr:DUF58 domain-containing protein [Spirochaetales bacterium]
MIGRLFLLILLIGLILFIPVPSLRFVLSLVLFIRLWAWAAEKLIPRLLSVERIDRTRYALCHREFDLELVIRNNAPFPVSYLTYRDDLSGIFPVGKRDGALSLRPFEEIRVTYRAAGDTRGVHTAGPVRLRGNGPFRLYSWEKRCEARQSVVVYPRVYRVSLNQNRGLGGGNIKITNRLYEDVTSFQSLREYIPGDELKRINWKVSARLGKLYSMEYDSNISFPVHIVLVLSAGAYPLTHREDLMERAIETAASLAVCFLRMGQKLSLITSSEEPLFISPQAGTEQSGRILGA